MRRTVLHDLALPMAIAFSIEQLQVDDLDMSTIKRWGSAYLSQFSLTNTREDMIRAAHELCEMQNYLIALVRRRMQTPEDDMLSDIIRADTPDEEPLSFEELVATARALLINTHDSMSTAFTNILFKVATDTAIAQQFYEAADDDSQMGRFIEELMRLEPPVRALSRVTTEPVTLGDTQLPEGAHLLILFASANDDEAVFECPRQFDSGRINIRKSLTFGAGAHLCLGISLARMQLLVAAKQTARRIEKHQPGDTDRRHSVPTECRSACNGTSSAYGSRRRPPRAKPMNCDPTNVPAPHEVDIPSLKNKYREERDRRLRLDGQEQYAAAFQELRHLTSATRT